MTVTPAFAVNLPSYAAASPYITVAEFLAEPTGADVSQLVPGQSNAAQAASLARLILRASAWVNRICHQTLAATTLVVAGEYRIQRDGRIWFVCPETPVIEVSGCSIGYDPSTLGPMLDLSATVIGRKVVKVPVLGQTSTVLDMPAVARAGTIVYAQLTYVSGYAVTTLAAPAAAGVTSVTPTSTLGIFPGLTLSIPDGANTEQVTVAPTYTAGSASVPLVSPLAFAHAATVPLTSLPGDVKEAVILLTSALIKTRGAEGIVMSGMRGQPSSTAKMEDGGLEEIDLAEALLEPYQRVI